MPITLRYKKRIIFSLDYTIIVIVLCLGYLINDNHAAFTAHTSAAPIQERYIKLVQSVVRVDNYRSAIGTEQPVRASLGTGTVIAPHYILTASHVIEGADSVKIYINGNSYTAIVVHASAIRDYAILYTPDYFGTPVKLGSSIALKVGDGVITVGNPLGLLNTLGVGFVSAPASDAMKDAYMYIQSWTQVYSGNSGGGLFNDNDELVGVVVRHAMGAFYDFSVPIDEIKGNIDRIITQKVTSPFVYPKGDK